MSESSNDSRDLLLETLATQAKTIQTQAQTIDRLQQLVLESGDAGDVDEAPSATFLDGSPRR